MINLLKMSTFDQGYLTSKPSPPTLLNRYSGHWIKLLYF